MIRKLHGHLFKPIMSKPAANERSTSALSGNNRYKAKVTVVLGAQWGDEGKGKVVDMLATEADFVCRCQGGNNACHTVVADGREFKFQLLPCGIINDKCISVIGNGVVIHLPDLFDEMERNAAKGIYDYQDRLMISDRAHLLFDFHKHADGMQEAGRGEKSIGTTKLGIGPAYTSKATRNGIRVGDLLGDFNLFKEKFLSIVADYRKLFPTLNVNVDYELERYRGYAEKIRPYVKNTIHYLNSALGQNKKIIVEGANAAMLDIDLGTYPYVTSSNCSIGGVFTGLGIPPLAISDVIGVVRAYTTRLGLGPFPTEQKNGIGKMLLERGNEISVAMEKRRCGWLDLAVLKYTSLINGYTAIFLTKLDILDTLPTIEVGVSYSLDGKEIDSFPGSTSDLARVDVNYKTLLGWQTSTENVRKFEDLPVNAQNYIRFIENELLIPVRWIGVGRGREKLHGHRSKPIMSKPAVNKSSASALSGGKVTVVLGTQWGEEGKGKVVDMLATEADIVCRCQGGSNACHTVVIDGREFKFQLLPSGIINDKCISIIGNGVVIHLPDLFGEMEKNAAKGLYGYQDRLIISDRAHLVFDFHKDVDGMQEAERGEQSIGTTNQGIGPAYTSKATNHGIQLGDLLGDFDLFKEKFVSNVAYYRELFPTLNVNVDYELERYQGYAKKIRPYVKDTIRYLHFALGQNKKILVEGANAAMLDIDFGTYPYVTSSNSSIGGVLTGLGIPAQAIGEVIGVVTAYTTRVGHGPFPTEQNKEICKMLLERGNEIGLTMQNRRCGWLDLAVLKYTSFINGYTAIFLTKLDVLDTLPTINVGVSYSLDGKEIDYFPGSSSDLARVEVTYKTLPGWQTSTVNVREFEDLPVNAQNYIRFIENELSIRVRWIGVGRGRESVIIV